MRFGNILRRTILTPRTAWRNSWSTPAGRLPATWKVWPRQPDTRTSSRRHTLHSHLSHSGQSRRHRAGSARRTRLPTQGLKDSFVLVTIGLATTGKVHVRHFDPRYTPLTKAPPPQPPQIPRNVHPTLYPPPIL